ncbi:hypothetical protein [Rhizobium sp. BK376]|uniref:hypothetical protein n=1 Tax=Rhizobium sp. BK376 TaxID=2512149 RepID=UPI00104C57A9|nr:hypothetical protein [Rhizobium sp. BK376]TCR62767.1 hypothetical protein EV561_1742 [Rhizobium sp. BK376]
MSEFSVDTTWKTGKRVQSELDATMCALQITVNERNVTQFRADSEPGGDCVELPSYFLAEWIAENWWAILWEPRKNEDGSEDDGDFLSRHSTLVAQHGFHLPQINFVSNGPKIHIRAFSRTVPFSDVKFPNSGEASVERSVVERVFKSFVAATVKQLEDAHVTGTMLQKYWSAIGQTDPEAESYCQMIGALGLSPYSVTPDIDRILDQMCDKLGEAYTLDLCLVARPEEFKRTAHAAKLAIAALQSSPDTNIAPLVAVPAPKDNHSTPAWYRGKRAAASLRASLSISETDPHAADRLFEAVGIDPSKRASIGDNDLQPEGAAIVGAMRRDETVAKISCIQRFEEQRRFTAARGLFSAWTSGAQTGHLLTQAVTRHQQASRAFAAELLAPIEYIRGWSPHNQRRITIDDVTEIAQNLKVGADVVFKQAMNNGYEVHRI